jgi:predicted transcriptional regulator YdeE
VKNLGEFMKSQKVSLGKIILVGTSVRTNNKNEMNPETAKIGPHFHSYTMNNLGEKIKHRIRPNVTYSVYTEYESNEHGEYTHFIGEAVDSLEGQDLSLFKTLTLPVSAYQKFTTASGPMPQIVVEAWQLIWQIKPSEFMAKRSYVADFEMYDEKSWDMKNAVVDIYIGID